MATGAGRTLSVSSADKVKEHQCGLAAARTVVLLLSSPVFFQLHGPRCGNACPQTSWCLKCAPAQSSWFGRWSMPSALRQQKQQPREGNIAGSWPPRQYGAIGPGAAIRHSSMKSQGEATMTQAQGSHSTLN
ncbi:hypothetical protein TcCL_Unassigned00082 [Trypanosoma cruzi]|nr:hypothetical protein TcCL_Unassigned00082 [Trypanosoma cruzi]